MNIFANGLKMNGNVYQYLAAFTSTIAILISGMNTGWSSPSICQLQDNTTASIHVTDQQGSWLAVMPLVGSIIGSLLAAAIANHLGRKTLILSTTLPFLVSWLIVAVGRSMATLTVGRLIGGVGNGITFTVVPMYLAEIADAKVRGRLGSSIAAMYILGMFLINALGSFLTIAFTALVSAVLPVVLLVTFWWMPESPYYLVMKKRDEEAKGVLGVLRGVESGDVEFNRISLAVNEQMKSSGRFFDLFSVRSNRKALFIALGLRTVQQLTGIMAVTFYAKSIFASSQQIPSTVSTLLYFGIQFCLVFVSTMIVDKFGRRPLLIFSIVGTSIALFVEGTYFQLLNNANFDVSRFSYVQIIALIGFVIMFSLGLQTVPILLQSELFPTNVKAFAFCLGDIYYGLAVILISKFFQNIKDKFGMQVPFYTFAGCCIFGIIFIITCVPETKGKTLEDIQVILKECNKRKKRDKDEDTVNIEKFKYHCNHL